MMRLYRYRWMVVCLLLLATGKSSSLMAQGSCPANIGFEKGNFTGWTSLDGKINSAGKISLADIPSIPGKHTLYKNTSPQLRDTFGLFPVNCPNGSGYSIKLGNSGAGAEAQGMRYTFTIPADQDEYSIIYNYAVVLQNPPNDHQSFEQPKFTSQVFDVAANKYVDCGSFQFIASPTLPGFRESTVEKNIYFKDWAPVTIKLAGYAGKTIRLEFTVNDCSKNIHFGYAYLDVDENCTTPITGNTYCSNTGSVVLKAPYGFKEYRWFDQQSAMVGTDNTLTLKPPPPGNTVYTLQIVPFEGQGCYDTLQTKIIASSDLMTLQVKDTVNGCQYPGADISSATVTAGSTQGLVFQYFTSTTQNESVDNPAAVTKPGVYYIKAIGPQGCSEIKPVTVAIKNAPVLVLAKPPPVCSPGQVDLTSPIVSAGSEPNLIYTYWRDTAATQVLPNPAAVSVAGRYFVKGTNATGCSTILPIVADIGAAPQIVINHLESCGELAMSGAKPTLGSDPSVQFSYWQDAAATVSLPASHVFAASGSFYAKATVAGGCSLIRPVQVTVHAFPVFSVTDPPTTSRPATVDLATAVPFNPGWQYSYWLDDQASKALAQPHEIARSGLYYIKATNAFGCGTTQPVTVVIIDPPIVPPTAFSPNNDGINDTWQIPILSFYADCTVEIFTRNGQRVYRSTGYTQPWTGELNGKALAIDTYYYIIRLAPDKTPVAGSVTLLK